MQLAIVIAQMVIAALPSLTTGITEAIAFINSIRSAAQQSGEWTADAETAYRNSLWATTQDPAYQPDAKG